MAMSTRSSSSASMSLSSSPAVSARSASASSSTSGTPTRPSTIRWRTSATPAFSASPFPTLRGSDRQQAPAARAWAAVSSVEPSSITTTSVTTGRPFSEATVGPTRPASLKAGTTAIVVMTNRRIESGEGCLSGQEKVWICYTRSQSTARGGSTIVAECSSPCQGTASASTTPRLPTLEPP